MKVQPRRDRRGPAGPREAVSFPDARDRVVGLFRKHPRGFGFLVPAPPTEYGDLFIPPGAGRDAITGDTVVARITHRGMGAEGARVEGEIVEILERGRNRFVGELVKDGKAWQVRPDGKLLEGPILVADARSSRA
ncbi:MAG TPA: hypothetical protein VLM89_17525, partial [Phycisphaerae bacterium]|nr:hypothetical protein [Phycisphaerae bacterium]